MSEEPMVLDAPAADAQGLSGEIEHPAVPTPADAVPAAQQPPAQEPDPAQSDQSESAQSESGHSLLPEGAYVEFP